AATIEHERNTVEDSFEFSQYISDNRKHRKAKKEIKEALLSYVRSIKDVEWKKMKRYHKSVPVVRSRQKQPMDRRTPPQLIKVRNALKKISTEEKIDFIAVQAIIGKMAEVTSYRTKRLELARQVFSPAVYYLICFMSLIIAAGFLFLDVDDVRIHGVMVVATVAALTVLYGLIWDLDHLFIGLWNIRKDPFDTLEEWLQEAGAPQGQAPDKGTDKGTATADSLNR
ncbi:MAG: DUF4239 domain-containing protein, partial [Dehalococcoidia bacterium]